MRWPRRLITNLEILECWQKLGVKRRLALLRGLQMAGVEFYRFSNPERLSRINNLNSKTFPQSARLAVEHAFQKYRVPGTRYRIFRTGFNVLKFAGFVRTVAIIRDHYREKAKGGQR